MSNSSPETCHENRKSSAQAETIDIGATEDVERLRRSERTRTLTEKGKEFEEEKLKSIQRRYRILYEKWRYHARTSKEILNDEASEDELYELIENMKATCSDVKMVYEELRRVQAPEAELRRRVDTCISLSGFIIQKAERHLKGITTEDPWPDVGSILNSTCSPSRPLSHQSQCGSVNSSFHSLKKHEAAAEAAASQEVLAVLDEQEKEMTELQRLEVEDKQRLAQFESENLARQQAMQEQRRKLERLEEVKKLNAARARVKVYDQIEENFKAIDLPHTVALAGEPQTLYASSPPFIPPSLPVASQILNASSPPFSPPSLPVASQTLLASNTPFIPQSLPATMQALHSPQSLQLVSQAPSTLVPIPQVQNSSDLVNVLAEAISANRLPTPEPSLLLEIL
ncbi:uncharacterized protein LOC119909695 [Micropterus salmoides]|uniref:uncharacterized protein LOC119909695 n=1 Tax=Micropterus salmoides TaxID=27706 RepID=UPI0018EA5C2B|nr:uncharacterized protein LOC119909695 [Micropterus salmoides]